MCNVKNETKSTNILELKNEHMDDRSHRVLRGVSSNQPTGGGDHPFWIWR